MRRCDCRSNGVKKKLVSCCFDTVPDAIRGTLGRISETVGGINANEVPDGWIMLCSIEVMELYTRRSNHVPLACCLVSDFLLTAQKQKCDWIRKSALSLRRKVSKLSTIKFCWFFKINVKCSIAITCRFSKRSTTDTETKERTSRFKNNSSHNARLYGLLTYI